MKKLSLLVGTLLLASLSFGQKPSDGAPMSLEGQIGLSSNDIYFASPSLRYRYFFAENMAVRATFGMNSLTNTNNYAEMPDGTGAIGTEVIKNSGWNFAIGGEYHFAGTEKLSPYGGLDIMLGGGKINEAWTNYDGTGYLLNYSAKYNAPTSMFGVNLVGGVDYYFAENFYFGLELGLGWQSTNNKVATTETTIGSVTVKGTEPASKDAYLGNNAIGTFRLGWRF